MTHSICHIMLSITTLSTITVSINGAHHNDTWHIRLNSSTQQNTFYVIKLSVILLSVVAPR